MKQGKVTKETHNHTGKSRLCMLFVMVFVFYIGISMFLLFNYQCPVIIYKLGERIRCFGLGGFR
jgi:hypothetical protein